MPLVILIYNSLFIKNQTLKPLDIIMNIKIFWFKKKKRKKKIQHIFGLCNLSNKLVNIFTYFMLILPNKQLSSILFFDICPKKKIKLIRSLKVIDNRLIETLLEDMETYRDNQYDQSIQIKHWNSFVLT